MIVRELIEVPARGRRPGQVLHRDPGSCGGCRPRDALLGAAPVRDAAAVEAAERRAAMWPLDVSDPWPAVRVGYGAPVPEPLTDSQLESVQSYLRSCELPI